MGREREGTESEAGSLVSCAEDPELDSELLDEISSVLMFLLCGEEAQGRQDWS